MNPENLEILSLKDQILKAHQEPTSLRTQRALIRKLLSSGKSLQGLLGLIRSNHGDYFNKAIGSWARKRGRLFELEVLTAFEKILQVKLNSGLIYRTPIERCGVQLYDLVLYLNSRVPIFIECKAGGVTQKDSFLVIDTQSRALKNTSERAPLIKDLVLKTGAPYWFVFPHSDGLALLDHSLILEAKGRLRVSLDKVTIIDQDSKIDTIYELYRKSVQEA